MLDRIIDGSNPREPVRRYYPGDDLFTPFERRRGLPIGNLTSQIFSNVYLDRFDHFVTDVLQAPYLRYVDDFALFADTRRGWRRGSSAQCAHANGADAAAKQVHSGWPVASCDDGVVHTAPVGSYDANAFGLFDVLGNVWEWTEDCWHGTYAGAPGDGAAWTRSGDCGLRVLRGGSWDLRPRVLRSALRDRNTTGIRVSSAGFRVSRTLDQFCRSWLIRRRRRARRRHGRHRPGPRRGAGRRPPACACVSATASSARERRAQKASDSESPRRSRDSRGEMVRRCAAPFAR